MSALPPITDVGRHIQVSIFGCRGFVFVHATALERSDVSTLNQGGKVSFEVEDDRRGRGNQAVNVQFI
jgi:hypothetical protein